ncbi:CIS tube protein [Janthinobacterium fluminis]|uniref:Peptidoglycan-binding protein n=1 Tax=Janthinobacterium fluminis TaxID=2987524 RepID=A0ABT5K607_9BURK|nr:peptidoglycan-binding protein [Janthinobacterium fluminis]MDC8760334.1 peptidoglycan-binding protein [Janthinobacterium fluminis]
MAGLSTGLKNKLTISLVDRDNRTGTSQTGVLGELASKAASVAGKRFEVLINPSGYQHELNVKYNKCLTLGQSGSHIQFNAAHSEQIKLPQLVFDGTGVVALYGMKSVATLIKELLTLVYYVNGTSHEPNLVRFQWGAGMMFIGRVTKIDIDYTLFKPNGNPLRAKVTLHVLSDMSVQEILLRANKSSPDLSHLVEVRAGDTLPLLCNRIYRDPGYYMAVARFNGLVNFRDLKPGTQLRFPPLS